MIIYRSSDQRQQRSLPFATLPHGTRIRIVTVRTLVKVETTFIDGQQQ